MALCSQTEYSEAGVRGKLKYWGAEPDVIDEVIEILIQEKFIDDLRFAIAYVRDKVRLNHWGRIKVRYMLTMDRISHSIVDKALGEIDEDLYMETLTELLQKKSRELKGEANPYNKKQKLLKFVQGRGFEIDLALKVLKDLE